MALRIKPKDFGGYDDASDRGSNVINGVNTIVDKAKDALRMTSTNNESPMVQTPGMALPGVPKDQIGPQQMQYGATNKVSLIPSDNVSTTVPAQLPSTVQTGTGQNTSDGQPISSAYGTASDFYAQISMNDIVDNTPSGAMTYAGYLAYNGITDPRVEYAQQLDAANEQYARALGTYGYAGEGLAQGNLANSGYSEYLNGVAYTQKAGAYRQALTDYQQKVNQYGQQYAQYKNDLANTNTQNAAKVYTYLAELGITSESDLYNASQALLAQGYSQADIDAGINNWRDRNAVSGGSEDGTSIPTSTQTEIYNYLAKNLSNASQLEAMKYQLKSNGYSDADIDAAIKNWEITNSASAIGKIGEITSLAVGNAQALKQQYGSGTAYDNALKALQEKNQELLDHFFEAEDFNDPMFYDFLAQYESDDGESAFDDMNDGDKVLAFRDYVKKLYQSGDISKEQYRAFNAKSLVGAIKEHLSDDKTSELSNGVFKAAVGATTGLPAGDLPQYKGGQGFLGAFEELAKFGDSDSLGEKGLEQAYNELANKMSVKFLKNGSPYEVTYINSKGKKMTMDMDQLCLRTPEQRKAFYAFAEWYKNKKA